MLARAMLIFAAAFATAAVAQGPEKEATAAAGNNYAAMSTTVVLTEGIQTTLILPLPEDVTPSPTGPIPTTSAAPVPISTAGAEQILCGGGSVLGMAVACGLGLLAI